MNLTNMQKEILITCNYNQSGSWEFQEDTWSDSDTVSSAKELFESMKIWHDASARTFSDYPLGGLYSHKNLSFVSQEVISIDGQKFYSPKQSCEPPTYFKEACDMFDKWFAQLKIDVPLQRKNEEAKNKRNKDLADLARLKAQYELI